MSKKSITALVSRGIDYNLSKKLVSENQTLTNLKHYDKERLIELGISDLIADSILKENRPPIPSTTVTKLLYESKRTCCICRDSSRSIIIHHIKEWSKSKDHSEDNLVVLCLIHHDEAHSKKELSLNLSEKQIKASKKKWIEFSKKQDALTILGLVNDNHSRWDYFNHNRIFELFLNKGLSNKNFKTTNTVKNLNLINDLGTFEITENKDKPHCYNNGNGMMLSYYMKELFESVLKKLPVIDLTDKFNREDIKSLIKIGNIISFQGAFYFKSKTKNIYGKNQIRQCYHKSNKIRLEFNFDAYETTSVSAWGDHLRGRIVVTPICYVKSILEEDGILKIRVSCLAIGSLLDEHQYRKEKYYS